MSITPKLTGTKGAAGVSERIAGQIPPHDVRIEAFWGRGTISRRLAASPVIVGLDLDPEAIHNGLHFGAIMFRCDAAAWLAGYFNQQPDGWHTFGGFPFARHFVYIDPPYLNTNGKGYYVHELDRAGHDNLLQTARRLPCPVAISHAAGVDLYEDTLADWRRLEYDARTHVGSYRESLWLNYDEPHELHDPRFAGHDHRHREAIAKRAKRWADGLARMPAREQQAVFAAVRDAYRSERNAR